MVTIAAINYGTYVDKIHGGWYGKCLGGGSGALVEGYKNFIDYTYEETLDGTLPNDDLDFQLLWLEALRERGMSLTARDLAEKWRTGCDYGVSEYGYFYKNLMRGIQPPISGRFNNGFFQNGMGCVIRSEIWAFAFPGNPALAFHYAKMDGELDHSDQSVIGEAMFAALESLCFTESDPVVLVERALAYIPADSKIARCVKGVLDCHRSGKPWRAAAEHVIARYSHHDFTNCVQNVGFTVVGLLYGGCDMETTVNICLACGYDVDCTCATACAIVGTIQGFSNLKSDIQSVLDDTFEFGVTLAMPTRSIRELALETARIGASLYPHTDRRGLEIILPDGVIREEWNLPAAAVSAEVEYLTKPSLGVGDSCRILLRFSNPFGHEWRGTYNLENIPDGFHCDRPEGSLRMNARGTAETEITFTTGLPESIKQTNILGIRLDGEDGRCCFRDTFGIAGAMVFTAYGPFFHQLSKPENPKHPPCHGWGVVLPSLEAMVNSEAFLDREYLDERELTGAQNRPYFAGYVNGWEDLLPIDETLTAEGQMCYYLAADVISPEDRKSWIVIGNSDAFRVIVNGETILERDEIRLYTPYNNAELCMLKKGVNRIEIKLLRRTDKLYFAFGLRGFMEGRYHHPCHWYTDLVFNILK